LKNQLEEKMTLFVENVGIMRNGFVWQEDGAKRLAALIYTLAGKKIDAEAIKEAHRMIKSEVGVFSTFRGNLSIYVAAALSLTEQPKQILSDTLRVYGLLKEQGFWASDYLVVAAFEIASKEVDHNNIIRRTKAFYEEMKANHRFHIGQDDYIFAVMLALSDMEPHAGANKMKQLFLRIKSEFSRFIGKSSLLTLSQMLVLGGSTEDCIHNLLRLNKVLHNRKIRLDRTYTLPSLGVLGILNVDNNTLADEMVEARDFLRNQKGLGYFSVTTQELLLYVASLVTYTYATDNENNLLRANLATSVTNLIIAQQVAIIVAISAASSANVAASS